nr:MAG: putative RNA-dependent RNA polymerase [Mitoviridae sp.]
MKGFLKLQTITTPGPAIPGREYWEKDIHAFFSMLAIKDSRGFLSTLSSPVKAMIHRSSPAVVGLALEDAEFKYSSSWVGIQQAAVSLFNSGIWGPFVDLHAKLAGPREGADRYWNFAKRIEGLAESASSTFKPGPLGRLGLKQEAAGKVRVFAMVDCWTQWLLKPLHLGIFRLLERIPADGTLNQLAPIHRLLDRGYTRFWSFDLSAATDRLPVVLQAYLLDYLLGETRSGSLGGQVWQELLVGRSYVVPKSAKKFARLDLPKEVKYAVGQPMGALSSWAMLALTHHFLVGVSAVRVGIPMGNFSAYALLGDDIVIADGRVARSYLQLMRELGVEIGLAKSLISRKGVLEFAKRYFVSGVDCSPVPLMELGVAFYSGMAALEFARKYALQFPRLVSVLGYGFRVKARLAVLQSLPKRLRGLAVAWYGPRGVKPVRLDAWVSMRSALEPLILNSPRASLSFEAYCAAILETIEARIKKFVKGTTGFTIQSIPKPVWQRTPPVGVVRHPETERGKPGFGLWLVRHADGHVVYPLEHPGATLASCRAWITIHAPEVKPDPYDDQRWLTYFTIRDQIRQAISALQIDLRNMQFVLTGIKRVLELRETKLGEPDLMELLDAYSKSMLLRNVRQICQPRPKDAVASFDRVLTMRKSLAKGLQEIIVSEGEIRGEGFVRLPEAGTGSLPAATSDSVTTDLPRPT